ncbi:MAG: DUF1579 family protein [Bacteroidales bacterium]
MKNITGLLILLMLISAGLGNISAQTADEIISKHIEAHGGMENWNAIQSMKITGQFTAFSETKPYTEVKARGGKYFSDHYKGQHRVIEGCDGSVYWVNDPWFDYPFPHLANDAEANVIRQKAVFCTPFFDYRDHGFKVEYQGMDEAEGRDCHKLILTRENGLTETWFLDAETFLEVMTLSQWADFAAPESQEAFYDDFREVNGVVIPFYTERVFSIRHRVTQIEEIQFNTSPDPSLFEMPLSPEMERLSFMKGEWDVVLETMSRGGRLTFADSTTSRIGFLPHKNFLQEDITYATYFPIEKMNQITYNSGLNKYLFTTYNGFYSRLSVFQGDFAGDTLVLEDSQVRFNEDEITDMGKYRIYPKDKNSMVVELDQSRDDGANWTTMQRFTYTRKND